MPDIKEYILYDSIHVPSKNRKNHYVYWVQKVATSLNRRDSLERNKEHLLGGENILYFVLGGD